MTSTSLTTLMTGKWTTILQSITQITPILTIIKSKSMNTSMSLMHTMTPTHTMPLSISITTQVKSTSILTMDQLRSHSCLISNLLLRSMVTRQPVTTLHAKTTMMRSRHGTLPTTRLTICTVIINLTHTTTMITLITATVNLTTTLKTHMLSSKSIEADIILTRRLTLIITLPNTKIITRNISKPVRNNNQMLSLQQPLQQPLKLLPKMFTPQFPMPYLIKIIKLMVTMHLTNKITIDRYFMRKITQLPIIP